MGNIQRIKPYMLNRENLDINQYAISLLKEGFKAGLITKQTIDIFQQEIIMILKDLIFRYTNKESTSIKIETAEQILNSIYYAIDMYALSLSDTEKSIEIFKNSTARTIYEKGFELLTTNIRETKSLYDKILENKLDVPMVTYNESIDEALRDFFIQYDPIFEAQNTMCTIDYPLAIDDMSLTGIRYIKEYLEKLEIETAFCKHYKADDINNLLSRYGQAYGVDYILFPINIYDVLLTNAIFTVLSGKSTTELMLSQNECKFLEKKLGKMPQEQINDWVKAAIKRVLEDMDIKNVELIDYIYQCQSILIPRILSGVKNGNLNNIMITLEEENENQNTRFVYEKGDKMDDDSFRKIVQEIMDFQNIEDKVDLIAAKIESLEDFVDILKADCFYGEEYFNVFDTLGDIELAILGRIVFYEDLRQDSFQLAKVDNNYAKVDWHVAYIQYLKHLGKKRLKSIENFLYDKSMVYTGLEG